MRGAPFAFAVDGIVYESGATGGRVCRLTSPMSAREPHLAPNGRHIAFLSRVETGGEGTRTNNTVHMLSITGNQVRDTTLTTDHLLHGKLAWAPDSSSLAFLDGTSLWVWRVACGCARSIITGSTQQPVQSFAWSPNSRDLAAFRAEPNGVWPVKRFPLTLIHVRTRRLSTIAVRFPDAIGGHPHLGDGSYASSVLGWTSDGHLLIGTSGWGMGLALTGIWSVSATGGRAYLIVGALVHGLGVKSGILRNAEAATISSARDRILVNTGAGFWIGTVGEKAGWRLTPRINRSCFITQVLWLSETNVAFVTVCNTGKPAHYLVLSTLSTSANTARYIQSTHSHDEAAISIAPPSASVFGGAG